jgi:hypothetical protein
LVPLGIPRPSSSSFSSRLTLSEYTFELDITTG